MFVYVCDRVLDHGVDEIHEQEVGQAVFGRPSDYDTLADNTVRVHASTLRKRIKQYFECEGLNEPLIIEIPRGNYAPVFLERRVVEAKPASVSVPSQIQVALAPSPEQVTSAPSQEQLTPVVANRRVIPAWVTTSVAVFFAVLSLVLSVYIYRSGRVSQHSPLPVGTAVWAQIFPKDKQTDVVLGDEGLGVVQEVTHQQIQLSQYFDRSYLAQFSDRTLPGKVDEDFAKSLLLKRQVSYADVASLMRLATISHSLQGDVQIHFAREYNFRDIKSNNAILLGHVQSNPWIEPYLGHMTLQWKFDSGSRSYYPVDTTDSNSAKYDLESSANRPHQAFATITLLPNLNRTGNVLILSATGGTAMAAAIDFLSDDRLLKELRNQLAPKDQATAPLPYFEALIRSGSSTTNLPRDTSIAIARKILP
jgi:hypothetical protein